jgi:hypothetical protein
VEGRGLAALEHEVEGLEEVFEVGRKPLAEEETAASASILAMSASMRSRWARSFTMPDIESLAFSRSFWEVTASILALAWRYWSERSAAAAWKEARDWPKSRTSKRRRPSS